MTTYHHVLHARRRRPRTTSRLAAGARAVVAHRDEGLRERLAGTLRRDGFEVSVVCDGRAVVGQLTSWTLKDGRSADLVVLGTSLDGWSGLDLAERLPETDWSPAILLVLDAEESAEHRDAEIDSRAPTASVFRAPLDEDDLRTVAVFIARRGRRDRAPRSRRPWRSGEPKPILAPPKELRMHDDFYDKPQRRRVELEINVQDAAPFDEIFDFADEHVAQLEPLVTGTASCTVSVSPSRRVPGAFEATVRIVGRQQPTVDARRRSHTAMGALRHAFAELRMRVRRPRSGVEMRAVGTGDEDATAADDESEGAAG